ncbi:hypothetical protein ARMSODRAFT_949365 [Armillaria solidipes]|uniref:TM7S3/TM198-like domain-containing protein n=1 Tax=Armillaria solidipes TaxID=1076256 RepID=A0A2H3CDZ7_9AGAR|nr:hypothetical protein ARMSODRAFT_949365 [Armillaria solidipes]
MRWPLTALLGAAFVAVAVVAQGNNNSSTSSSSTQTSASTSRSSSSGSSSSASSSASSASLSLSLTTSSRTITTSTTTNGQNSQYTTVVPTTFNVTYTATPTSSSASSSSAASSASASASASATPITLDTKLDPAFGVLGAILILTGLPSAFWGHKNRWSSFFLIGFYTLSLVCFVLIIRFGVLEAVNPPSQTIRGMFVLACSVAGIAGGAIAIFFWKAARYCIGAWGGLAFGWWIQCFRNGGLISSVGLRWILYIGCAVIGFVLSTIPKIHYHILLISTAFVGASALMLGVDCYTTAGLKEFYVWNLGFRSLFPKFQDNGIRYPVSQSIQIELGLLGAVALMGAAVQLRILSVLQHKLKEISQEQQKQNDDAEQNAAGRFNVVLRERSQWEKEHGHERVESGYSSMPLMKDLDGSSSPVTPDRRSMDYQDAVRQRYQSGVSDFMTAPIPEDELRRATSRSPQGPGALPALDLGLGIENDVPTSFISKDPFTASPTTDKAPKRQLSAAQLEAMKKKEDLVAEIENIRKSIDALKGETPSTSASNSRGPSIRAYDAATSLLLPAPSHSRPPREPAPRGRVRSLDYLGSEILGESISRPTSVPLRDPDWDAYIQDRKLLQPPRGVTPPIGVTKIQMSPAVAEALKDRKRKETSLGYAGPSGSGGATESSEDVPIARKMHRRSTSAGTNAYLYPPAPQPEREPPVAILPPKKIAAPTPQRPVTTRTRTFEELAERHREKMRDLQGPVTTAHREHAELEAAKARWEKSRVAEREAMKRRETERERELRKRREAGEKDGEKTEKRRASDGHKRSLSADRLAQLGTGGSHSRRLSTMKVEDWQRYQQEVVPETDKERPGRRESRRQSGVPFPDDKHVRRKSREPLS